jgi:hypothetical protein
VNEKAMADWGLMRQKEKHILWRNVEMLFLRKAN